MLTGFINNKVLSVQIFKMTCPYAALWKSARAAINRNTVCLICLAYLNNNDFMVVSDKENIMNINLFCMFTTELIPFHIVTISSGE